MPKQTANKPSTKVNTRDKRVGQEYEGQCMSCRAKKKFTAESVNTWSNGNEAAVGPCPTCGTKINRILPKAKK